MDDRNLDCACSPFEWTIDSQKFNKKIVITLLLFFTFFLTNLAETAADPERKPCTTVMNDIAKRQLGGISKCIKTMEFKSDKEKSTKINCILKCVMINDGLFNAEGQLTQETIDSFVEKEIPAKVKEQTTQMLTRCKDKHGGSLDSSEETCQSFDKLLKCTLGAMLQPCPK